MPRIRLYRSLTANEHPVEERELDGLEGLMDLLTEPKTVTWAVIDGPDETMLRELPGVLSLHPLSAEDLREDGDRPRIRRHENRLSMVLASVREADEDGVPTFSRLNAFAGLGFLVTVSDAANPDVEEAVRDWAARKGRLALGATGPLYLLLDTLLDTAFEVLDDLADRLDDLEDQVVQGHSPDALAQLFTHKRALLHFRRVAAGMRDVASRLLRMDDLFPHEAMLYFQDAYDHALRITETLDSYHDLLSNAMDAYLSVTSNEMAESANRLNEVMQTLTSWSIILGACSFIAGFYGINVVGLPFSQRSDGILMVAGLCLLTGGLLFALFRRKRWI